MRSAHQVLDEILHSNSMLQFGLSNRLFNLSQLAKFLAPSVIARTKKEVTEGSIVMALSRIQRDLGNPSHPKTRFSFRNIQVTSNLCIHTYAATPERRRSVVNLTRELQNKGRSVSFTQGLSQLTIFFSREDLPRVKEVLTGRPLNAHNSIAVIGGIFDERFSLAPGFFNAVFQQLYTQGVNVVEVASTYTELLIYVEEKDMRIAFDTLYARFVRGDYE